MRAPIPACCEHRRLSREVNRRTRVALLFPAEASVLRLVSAVAVEIAEGWEDLTRLPQHGRRVGNCTATCLLCPRRCRLRREARRMILVLSQGGLSGGGGAVLGLFGVGGRRTIGLLLRSISGVPTFPFAKP